MKILLTITLIVIGESVALLSAQFTGLPRYACFGVGCAIVFAAGVIVGCRKT